VKQHAPLVDLASVGPGTAGVGGLDPPTGPPGMCLPVL
jgi:hypothetical protein